MREPPRSAGVDRSGGRPPTRGPRTVLFIDEAASFGGSLVVSALLIKHLDPGRYRAVVVGEADREVLEHLFGATTRLHRVPRPYDYRKKARLAKSFGGSSAPFLVRLFRHGLHLARRGTNLSYFARLAWIVLRERPDIIHHSNGHIYALLLLFRKPIVATAGGITTRSLTPREQSILKRMSAFIMISQIVQDHYLAAGGPPEIARLIPNPCDPEPIPAELPALMRSKLGIAPRAKVFGIVGRVVPWKGQKEFLAAAEIVLAKVSDAVAVIVGDAADGTEEYFQMLKWAAERSPHASRIKFTGYVADMKAAYAILDVAVHASIKPEPFGLVITEAMGYGIPVVAANTGAPPEIVDHGIDGFLVDPKDSHAMAQAIGTLLCDDGLRSAMAARGIEKVRSRYGADLYAEKVQDLYDEVLGITPE